MACAAALTLVEAELPVVSDSEVARQARLLLDTCRAARVHVWVFALALSLEHGPTLAGVRLLIHRQDNLCSPFAGFSCLVLFTQA